MIYGETGPVSYSITRLSNYSKTSKAENVILTGVESIAQKLAMTKKLNMDDSQ